MRKWALVWLGGVLLASGCTTTKAKRPEQVEIPVQEFTVPPESTVNAPAGHGNDRPSFLRPANSGSLNTNPAGPGGVGMPSPSPNFMPNQRR